MCFGAYGRSGNGPRTTVSVIIAVRPSSPRAVELLDEAVQHMILFNAEGVGTLGSDPYLLPLRKSAPFRMLLRPASIDGVR